MNKYSNIVRDVARKFNVPLVDLREKFVSYDKQNNKENKESGILTKDKVHLNDKGNELVAEVMWKAIKSLK
jgi:lysophospholipase L1-like esterase